MFRPQVCAAVLCSVLFGPVLASAEPDALPQDQVFRSVFATPASLPGYMTAHAGRTVVGTGHLEAAMPRATFDSSIPDSNPALAVIHLQPGRKVTCGLRKALTRHQYHALQEGTPVGFEGMLVDAQDWGEWRTVYLSDCQLTFQP